MAEPRTETDFGLEPEGLLLDWAERLDASLPVLDIGAGVGRNLLWLLRRGFRGQAIESDPAVADLLKQAAGELPLRVHVGSFDSIQLTGRFGAILVFGLLPVLQPAERESLLHRVQQWIAPGGLVFLTGFTNGLNPGRWPGELQPGQIQSLLPDAELLSHEEEIGPWHRHGDGPEHRHAWARAVFRC